MTAIRQELRAAHDPPPDINLYYPAAAGHAFLGEPPYFPYSDYGTHGNPSGGTQQANAQAVQQSWPKMINFIKRVIAAAVSPGPPATGLDV